MATRLEGLRECTSSDFYSSFPNLPCFRTPSRFVEYDCKVMISIDEFWKPFKGEAQIALCFSQIADIKVLKRLMEYIEGTVIESREFKAPLISGDLRNTNGI